MPVSVTIEEYYKDSRNTSISNETVSQVFKFYIYGELIAGANVDATFGPDDDLEAVKAAYSVIPMFRTFPLYDGTNIVLTLENLELKMIQYDIWEVTCTYQLPDSGGSSGGGYSQNVNNIGPNVGDYQQWSNSYVQLDVNVISEQIPRKMGLKSLACQKNVDATDTSVPYTAGKPAPIGMTASGIEGANVYARQFDFGLTVYFRPQKLTIPYVRRLNRMACSLNTNLFFGLPRGSVLFTEATFSSDVFSVVPVNFQFKVRNNFKFSQTGPTVYMDPNADDPAEMYDTYHDPYFPDAATGPEPGGAFSGWCEVDYLYHEKPDNGALIQQPYLRTIHQMYEYSNFARFEL